MSNVVAAAVEGVVRTWKKEAEDRRRIYKTDPVADALEYCAGEIVARVRAVQDSTEHLTVEQYAKRENVTPQTVRNWIRSNQLAATPTSKGYMIEATVKRVRRSA